MSPPWHVFVSYNRGGSTEQWLDAYFLPSLERRLHDALTEPPRIFVDRKAMASGSPWKTHIGDALSQAPLTILLLTRKYFASPWCTAEMDFALTRRRRLREAGAAVDTVIALQMQDGRHNPSAVQAVTIDNWTAWNRADGAFERATDYSLFVEAVARLADDIADRLGALSAFPLPDVPLPEVFDDVDHAEPGPLLRIQP